MDSAGEKPYKKAKCCREEDEQQQQEPRNGLEDLPRDVAFSILSSLPITSLLQSRCVSRAWRELSTDPDLLQLHSSRVAAGNNNLSLVLHCDYPLRNRLYFVELADLDRLDEAIVRKIRVPFGDLMPEYSVTSSCNGFLLLSDSLYGHALYMYNPLTREFRELPKCRQFDDQQVVLGSGFDPSTNEFKVIRIVYHSDGIQNRRHRRRIRPHPKSDVQIWSFNSTIWKSIGEIPYQLERQQPAETFVNGRLHWLTPPRRSQEVRRRNRSIISFDLTEEKFQEVPKPNCGSLNRLNYHLTVLGGCLSAVVCCHFINLEIWVMKEYNVKESWTKEFVIGDCSPSLMKPMAQLSHRVWQSYQQMRNSRVLCLLKDGNLLIEYRGGVLVSHDPYTGKYKKLEFQGMPSLFQAHVHSPNLDLISSAACSSRN